MDQGTTEVTYVYVCMSVSPSYLICEHLMEGDDVGMTLTELQDRDLTAGVVPGRTTSPEKYCISFLLSIYCSYVRSSVLYCMEVNYLLLMILTAYCIPVLLSVHTLHV